MKQAHYYLLDVFTSQKYGGNQLAIFPDATSIDEGLFQTIARELNLSETVFLFPPASESDHYAMRIFTPGMELPTAGHPTVGTAYFLAGELGLKAGTMKLQQKVGLIEVQIAYEAGLPDMITMYQPLPVFGKVHDRRRELAEMLSLGEDDLDDLPIQEVSCGNNTLLVPVKSVETLKKTKLRLDLWDGIKDSFGNALVYTFTVHGVKGGDVQGRMFAPAAGIAEDPATGSANGPLVCYLSRHKVVSAPLLSLQGYEMGRPSQLHLDVTCDEDEHILEVKVGGKSMLIGKGTLFLEGE